MINEKMFFHIEFNQVDKNTTSKLYVSNKSVSSQVFQ